MSETDKSISEQICEAVAQLLEKEGSICPDDLSFFRGSGAIGEMVDTVADLSLEDGTVMITTYTDFPEQEAKREEWEEFQERKKAFEARYAEIEEEGGDPDDPDNYDDDVWVDEDEEFNIDYDPEYGEPEYEDDTYELSRLDECDLIDLYNNLRDAGYDLPEIEGC